MAQEHSSPSNDLHLNVDDFYFSALFDENHDENEPVSDSKYAEELQFQEALVSSAMIAAQPRINVASSSSSSSTTIQASQAIQSIPIHEILDHIRSNVASSSSSSSSTMIQASQAIQSSPLHEIQDHIPDTQEVGKSFCGICVDMKEADQMFRNVSCVHSFCSDCITKHVATKIQDNIHIVTCPSFDCRALLELDACRSVLPADVLERWNDALCEALVLGTQRIYCPFSDCSMALMIDNEGEVIRESECPACHRLFCAGCQVPWHPGVDCEEFQRLNEDERGRADLMVTELAKQKKWKRCPRCKFYVEKTEGCLHITCRCNFQFCYGCGAEYTSSHGGCQRT